MPQFPRTISWETERTAKLGAGDHSKPPQKGIRNCKITTNRALMMLHYFVSASLVSFDFVSENVLWLLREAAQP